MTRSQWKHNLTLYKTLCQLLPLHCILFHRSGCVQKTHFHLCVPAHVNSPLLQTRIVYWTKFKCFFSLLVPHTKILKFPLAVGNLLTNKVSRKIVLNLNIIVIFSSIFIDKYSLEVVREKASVGSQVKFEMSTVKKKKS